MYLVQVFSGNWATKNIQRKEIFQSVSGNLEVIICNKMCRGLNFATMSEVEYVSTYTSQDILE